MCDGLEPPKKANIIGEFSTCGGDRLERLYCMYVYIYQGEARYEKKTIRGGGKKEKNRCANVKLSEAQSGCVSLETPLPRVRHWHTLCGTSMYS